MSTTLPVLFPTPHDLADAGGQPANSGKRYKTLEHVTAVWSYINRFGVQSQRYEWRIARHDDGMFELYRFPREELTAWGEL